MDTSQIIIAVIGSNALFAFIQFLITRHDQKKNALSKHEQAQNDMIIGLGHDKLLYLTDKFVQRGGIWIIFISHIEKPVETVIVRLDTKLAKNCLRSAMKKLWCWTEE